MRAAIASLYTGSPAGRAPVWMTPHWEGDGGARQLFAVGLPMILSQACVVVNLMCDRLFLAQYDRDLHMTAALSAGVTWWWAQHFALGVLLYLATFVSQYLGAQREHRIGAVVWQGIYLAGALVLANVGLYFAWGPFFAWTHPGSPLAALEADYCHALTWGAPFLMINTVLSSYYLGRGKTQQVFLVSVLITICNVFLNWWLIFSPPAWLPFVKPGLEGAAWATSLSFVVGFACYLVMVALSPTVRRHRLWPPQPVEWPLLRRVVRFGAPQGLQFFLDMSAFSIFVLLVGRVSESALTATNIAITINMVAFSPMMGFSQGVGILVGRFMGAERPDIAQRVAPTALAISLVYTAALSLSMVLVPDLWMTMFLKPDETIESLGAVAELTRWYMLLVAVYQLADAVSLIYAGALKGAGDTHYVMYAAGGVGIGLLVTPCVLIVTLMDTAANPLWAADLMWIALTAFILGYAVLFAARYVSGWWKTMRVIEPVVIDPLSLDNVAKLGLVAPMSEEQPIASMSSKG